MAETVERVEGERCRKDGLTGNLDSVGEGSNGGDHVCGGEGIGCDEVAKRESVEDCGEAEYQNES
jgi:hypothetical protein